MSVKDPGSFRLVATLGATGLVAGLVLASVFLGTKPAIERNRAEALRAAILGLLPGTETITELRPEGGELVGRPPGGESAGGELVYSARDAAGDLLGYAVPAEGPGYMDTVGLIYGYEPRNRTIVGIAILESRETPGLGDKIIADPAFHENFRRLRVEPTIVPVKRGRKNSANEVDCITGATISSEAVVTILNRSVERWIPLLKEPPRRERASDAAAASVPGGGP